MSVYFLGQLVAVVIATTLMCAIAGLTIFPVPYDFFLLLFLQIVCFEPVILVGLMKRYNQAVAADKKKLKELKLFALDLSVEHLKACIKAVENRGDQDAATAIATIMQREALQKIINRLKYMTKPNKGVAVYSVRVRDNREDV